MESSTPPPPPAGEGHDVDPPDQSREANEPSTNLPEADSTNIQTSTPTPREPSPPPDDLDNSELPDREDQSQKLESQPMTNTNSTSSLSASKEDDNSGPTPYGTRSRNRTGSSRPNYADDSEPEEEAPTYKRDATSSQRSTPPAVRSKVTAPAQTEPHTGPRTIKLHTSADYQNLKSGPSSEHAHSTPEVEGAGEKKKRKLDRSGQSSRNSAHAESRSSSGVPRDSIPGTSQFSANFDDTAEHPPAKRRKAAPSSTALGTNPNATSSQSSKLSLSNTSKQNLRGTCTATFEKSGAILRNGCLEADDGSVFSVDDHVYLICEPPGDPYYLCRIMEFRQADPNDPQSPIKTLLVNWFYRPKDIGRYHGDPRFLFASMQSDESPLTSLRGKCEIRHRSEISDFEEYRKQRDTFWFSQLYDRYIHRPYEVIPSSSVINVPENVKKALDERWKFLVVEPARMKELTSAVKLCKRCSRYCAPNDSVDCGVCRNTYHMTCVRPPLSKKPSRGFAWSCGPCSRAQEKRLEQRHAAIIQEGAVDRDDEMLEDDDDDGGTITAAPDPGPPDTPEEMPVAQAEVAQADMWPWRYLGIHCRVEDVLQYDDRAIYPRASSRLGPRHQANILAWPGRPLKLVKPVEVKKRYIKGANNKKDAKLSKETVAALEEAKIEKSKRPKWIQDEPIGYVARGEDLDGSDPESTARLLFKPEQAQPKRSFSAANATTGSNEHLVDDYMIKVRALAKERGLTRKVFPGFRNQHKDDESQEDIVPTNFLDQAIQLLSKTNFNAEAALEELGNIHSSKDIGDPELTKEEVKKFEDGVKKHGSDLRGVRKHVKPRTHAEIVRFYYGWKKSERGQEIWSNHTGRRGTRRRAETSWTEIADDEDDSAFDNEKATQRKRKFHCKFCSATHSRQWRRAPNVAPGATVPADPKLSSKDKSNQLIVALCQRCAGLWRRYGIRWEDPEEMARAINPSGGRAWKRKNDEEMLREFVLANEAANVPTGPLAAEAARSLGIPVTVQPPPQDPQRLVKRAKGQGEKETTPVPGAKGAATAPPPRQPTPPIVPASPKMRDLPCSICGTLDAPNDQLISCKECKLTVHRRCYAVSDQSNPAKWVCDTCMNDKNNSVSVEYRCVLCPVHDRPVELVEPPRATQKKRTEREKEKEKLEKDLAEKMLSEYMRHQEDKGRPVYPRDALKTTASNNWMHVICSIWTPEIRFGDAEKMERAEGMAAAVGSSSRLDQACKLCKEVTGTVITCHQCHAPFHVGCAHEAGYFFGFDVTPIKGSRKDSSQNITLTNVRGTETGSLTAAVWCSEHSPIKTNFHDMTEVVPDSGLSVLQTYVRFFKQADLTLTGTARKANLLNQSTKAAAQALAPTGNARRTSLTTNGISATSKPAKNTSGPTGADESNGHVQVNGIHGSSSSTEDKRCETCGIHTSLRWWPLHGAKSNDPSADVKLSVEYPNKFLNGIEFPRWQCHKCHTRERLGLSLNQPDTRDTEEEEDVDEEEDPLSTIRPPDYFAATAPPRRTATSQASSAGSHPVHPLPPFRPAGTPGVYYSRQDLDAERFTHTLWASTVVLHNFRLNKHHPVPGFEFGNLSDPPQETFQRFLRSAAVVEFDPRNHVFTNEYGLTIQDPTTLSKALVSLIQSNEREVHWRLVEGVENKIHPSNLPEVRHNHLQADSPPYEPGMMRPSQTPGPPPGPPGLPGPPPPTRPNGMYPPPSVPAVQQHQQQPSAPAYTRARPPPNQPGPPPGPPHGPHHAHSPGPSPGMTQEMPIQNTSAGSPPFFNHQPVPPPYHTGSASPPKMPQPSFPRSSTPRDQHTPAAGSAPGSVGGASSSPSLKNLMH